MPGDIPGGMPGIMGGAKLGRAMADPKLPGVPAMEAELGCCKPGGVPRGGAPGACSKGGIPGACGIMTAGGAEPGGKWESIRALTIGCFEAATSSGFTFSMSRASFVNCPGSGCEMFAAKDFPFGSKR
mmetsp:Transcript_50613/g.68865  ORF Transcript_50613/g.68865 Transcript_50613/m.68865 type:complete len:128 (+) Transcript_50613:171-554(+)